MRDELDVECCLAYIQRLSRVENNIDPMDNLSIKCYMP